MRVAAALLEAIERRTDENTALYDAISRVAPATDIIEFHSAEELEDGLKPILVEWLPRLTGRSLHVRLRQRGDGHQLRTPRLTIVPALHCGRVKILRGTVC